MLTGIIGAMELEVDVLKHMLKEPSFESVAGMVFMKGRLFEQDVIVVKCGIGKVNAAVCAQILISVYGVSKIINTGIAGAISDKVNIGDVVISEDLVQHDFDTSAVGDIIGVIPGLNTDSFTADEKLKTLAFEASKEVLGEENKTFIGRIATGDQFISTTAQKEKIRELFNAYCAEMEGGAVAQVCFLHEIPFVVIRTVSDKADNTAEVDFAKFAPVTARKSASIVTRLLKALPTREN